MIRKRTSLSNRREPRGSSGTLLSDAEMIVLREGAAGFYPRETALRFDRPVYWVYERRRRIPKAFGVRTFEGALMSAFREEIIR